jgi:hypothetical protein
MLKRKSSTELSAAGRRLALARTVLERARIKVDRSDWHGTTCTGTRDAMIAAELVTPEQVPGEPTCPKTHVFRFERAGRLHTVSLFRHRTLVKLNVGLAREEVDAQLAQRKAEHKVAELPASREKYEDLVRRCVSFGSVRCLPERLGGYSLSESAIDEFEQAVAEALDELLEHVTFSRAARDRAIAAWRQEAADADPDFARFMKTARTQPNG